ncbi:type II toxin-antitoxin system RelE/ParE family toxin [soil metagenome]
MWVKIQISDVAEKQLRRLDRQIQKRLLDYLSDRLDGCKNPRHFGEPLKGDKIGYWRYRVGDFRIICDIKDEELIVLALTIGHRQDIYK